MDLTYDEAGKVDLSDIYDRPDPVKYFTTLSKLGYRVAQEAKGPFKQLIGSRREVEGRGAIKVVDVGCSYGVNAALLKHDLTIAQLTDHYADAESEMSREKLMARDHRFFARPDDVQIEVVGIDVAEKAVRYAVDAGILDAGVTSDLEQDDIAAEDAERVAGADVIISTGCYGYVTERTFEQILDQCDDSQPWLANMVLRMFDFSAAAALFEERGYVTEKIPGAVPQRRFASAEERRNVLDNLASSGVDASSLEDTGWYYADLYISRPEDVARELPIEQLVQALDA